MLDGQEGRVIDESIWQAALLVSGDLAFRCSGPNGQLQWLGDAAHALGLASDSPPGTWAALAERIHPDDLVLRTDLLERSAHLDCDWRVRGEDGAFRWLNERSGPVEGGRSGVLRRIDRHKAREGKLDFLASFDELTGHFNHVRLREALDRILANSQRAGNGGALMLIGVDALARINRAYGFAAGDAVLVEVGRRLDRALRDGDMIARLAGDRFGVVMGRVKPGEARRIAERVCAAGRRDPVQTPAGALRVSVSVGVSLFPEHGTTTLDVFLHAETALEAAKVAGRDRLSVFDPSREGPAGDPRSIGIGRDLQAALRNGKLLIAYQPVLDARTGEVRHHEGLVRVIDSAGALVAAGRFMRLVERLGLSRALDRQVLNLVLDDLERCPEVTLAVNVSGPTTVDRAWRRALTGRLRDHPEVASRLIIEITETSALSELEETAQFVGSLRDLGCRVALDDFGAGFTTFRHLRALSVDEVKIDASFVRGIHQASDSQLFVRTLLGLADTFKLATVAEGVETREEADYLARAGLDMLQGFYFGRPEVSPGWREDGQASKRLPPHGLTADFRGLSGNS